MAKTLNDSIGAVIAGQHVMGVDGLRDYHAVQAVKAVKAAKRIKSDVARYMAIQKSLKNWRVLVSFTVDERIRIMSYATQAEVIL